MRSLKLFFQSFIPAFFFFSMMIMATVLWVSPFSKPQRSFSSSHLTLPSDRDSLTVLAIHADQTLQSLSLISIKPKQGEVLIHSFPPNSIINGNKLSTLWKNGEKEVLLSLLSSYSGYQIQRQIQVNDRQLNSLIDYFGPISVVLEEKLCYKQSGLSVTMEPGFQRLNSVQCQYYLQQASSDYLRARRCDKLLQNAINENWSVLASAQAQKVFLDLLDLCDTDLSVNDLDRYGEPYAVMAQLIKQPAIIKKSSASYETELSITN